MPTLIEHFNLSDAERDNWAGDLRNVADNALMNPHLTHDLSNAILGQRANYCLPLKATQALNELGQGKGMPVIVLHNVPMDQPLPRTPDKTETWDIARKGWISEYVLRGIANIMACRGHFDDDARVKTPFVHAVESPNKDFPRGLPYHRDGGGRATSKVHFNTLLCLRGHPEAKTYFSDATYEGTPVGLPSTKAYHVTLQPGDLVVFDNQRVLHGVGDYPDSPGEERRWLESLALVKGQKNRYRQDGVFVSDAYKIMSSRNLAEQIHETLNSQDKGTSR